MLFRAFFTLMPPLAALMAVVSLNIWTFKNPQRFDLTEQKIYSVSDESLAISSTLEGQVEIVYFYDSRSRAMLDHKNLLEQTAKSSVQIALRSFDPVLEPSAAEKHKVRFAGTTVFQSATRRLAIHELGEEALLNALITVTSGNNGKICFSDGHLESNPFSLQSHDHFEGDSEAHSHSHSSGGQSIITHELHGMGMAKNALETLGYEVEKLQLTQHDNGLDSCLLIIVASPQFPFSEQEVKRIHSYLDRGGGLLALLEPETDVGFHSILDKYGIEVGFERILDPAKHYWKDPYTPAVSDYERHRITRHLPLTFFPGVAEIKPVALNNRLRATPVIRTSDQAYSSKENPSDARPRVLGVMVQDTVSGAVLGVVGDGDFATNSFFKTLGNGHLFLNLVTELTRSNSYVDIVPREYQVAKLTLTNQQLEWVFLATTVVGPLVIFLIGLLVWVNRR